MRLYDYCIFDNDGVILDTIGEWVKTIRSTSREFGLKLTDADIRMQLGDLRNVAKQGLQPDTRVVEYCNALLENGKHITRSSKLYPGVKFLLQQLMLQEHKLAMVSANPSDIVEPLKLNGVHDFFEVIITGHDVTHTKPHPEGLELALDRMNGTKESAVMIGDSIHDLMAANAFGIASVLFYPPHHAQFHDKAELLRCKPTHVVASHKELGELLIRRETPSSSTSTRTRRQKSV